MTEFKAGDLVTFPYPMPEWNVSKGKHYVIKHLYENGCGGSVGAYIDGDDGKEESYCFEHMLLVRRSGNPLGGLNNYWLVDVKKTTARRQALPSRSRRYHLCP